MSRSQRVPRNIQQRTTILILCCGETERRYFEDLREHVASGNRNIQITVRKCCGDPDGMGESLQHEKEGSIYEKIFCVLDKDTFPDIQINNLKKKADAVAEIVLQIPAFEVWEFLHFDYSTAQKSALEWVKYLQQHIYKYKKGKSFFYTILPLLNTAINNTKKQMAYHSATPGTDNNPSCEIPKVIHYINSHTKTFNLP